MNGFEAFSADKEVIESIKSALSHRFPQTVLLTGAKSSGKWSLAHTIAAYLLCTGEGKKPCKVCPSCVKLEHNSHPDLDVIDEGDKEITVDIARNLRKNICILPNDGDKRVVIIRNAHKMNIPAQNALLKILEEPPKYAFFILTTDKSGEVLETIRSRCTKYNLAPKNEQNKAETEQIQFAKGIIESLGAADEYQLLVNAMKLEKLGKAQIQNYLGVLQTALRDCIISMNGMKNLLLPELNDCYKKMANRISDDRLIKLYDWIGELILRTKLNAAASLISTTLCAGAFGICFIKSSEYMDFEGGY